MGTWMKITIKESSIQNGKKLVCPYCGTPINSFWLKDNCKISGITTKCKRCGKTLEITVE